MIDFLIYLATICSIWGILALSLNLQYGITGLVNLGHIAFFMIGGYISTILVVLAGWPIGCAMLAGAAAAGLYGVLLALPTSGLQQDYWAICTLAAAEIVRMIFLNQTLGSPYVGASFGVSKIPQPLRDWFSAATYPDFYLVLTVACLLICWALVHAITRTPYGRVLKAIREGDEVPLALGKRVRSARIRAMGLGGALAGLAGALFAHYNAFISPQYFLPMETFLVWAMVIVGGGGNNLGALVGTVVVQTLFTSSRFLKDVLPIDADILGPARMLLIAVLVIMVIIYLPEGLLPERRRRYGRRSAVPEPGASTRSRSEPRETQSL